MSKVKGKVSVDLIDVQTVNIDVDTIVNRLSSVVETRLGDYYIYGEKPYLDTDSSKASVETTLYNVDDHESEGFIDWDHIFHDTIKELAKENINPTE